MIPAGIARTAELARQSTRLTPLAGASVVSLLNSLAIAVLYARIGGPRSFGIYQIGLAAAGAVGVLALSGAGTAATRAAAQGRQAAWPLFRMRLPYTAGAGGVLLVAGLVVAATGNGSLGATLGAAGAATPLFLGADVFPAELVGAGRYRDYFLFQLVVQGLTLAAVATALVMAPHEPWLAMIAMAGTTGVIQFAGLLTSRRGSFAEEADFRYARRVTGVTILSAVDVRLDVLLTGALLGAQQTGLLAIARALPGIVRRVWDVLYPVFFRRLAAVSPRDALEITNRYRMAVVVALGIPSIAGVLAAPTLVPLLFGREFHGAVRVTQLLLIANAVAPLALLEAVMLKAQGDLRRLGLSYIILPVVSLVAMPPLIWAFGLEGVGIEAILAAAVSVVLYVPLARRSAAQTQALE